MLPTRTYIVACQVCGRERKSEGFDFENAFITATGDGSGWTWRYSPSQEWVELLCPEHVDIPTGCYGGEKRREYITRYPPHRQTSEEVKSTLNPEAQD